MGRADLLRAGVSTTGIWRRLQRGTLLREYPGVYRVGHRAPSVEASYLAAVYACGAGAALSGRAAAYEYGLLKGAPPPPEVTARTQRRVKGLAACRCRTLSAADVTIFNATPVTTVPRTLVDLAAVLTLDGLARACHEAGVRYRTTPAHVDAILARRPEGRVSPVQLRRRPRGARLHAESAVARALACGP